MQEIVRGYERIIAESAVRHANQVVALEMNIIKLTEERNQALRMLADIQAANNRQGDDDAVPTL